MQSTCKTRSSFEYRIMTRKIEQFKEENDLSLLELSKLLNVDKSHLYRIIQGTNIPSLNLIIRLAKIMELPVFTLFLPSEENLRDEFALKVQTRLRELNFRAVDLMQQTGIQLLRLNDIIWGKVTPLPEEKDKIIDVLGLEKDFNYMSAKLNILENILADLNLKEHVIDNILKYIQDNVS